jgi:hypothetical protein
MAVCPVKSIFLLVKKFLLKNYFNDNGPSQYLKQLAAHYLACGLQGLLSPLRGFYQKYFPKAYQSLRTFESLLSRRLLSEFDPRPSTFDLP